MQEEILDYNSSGNRHDKLLNLLFVLASVLFLYWFVGGFAHWPFASMALFIGLFLLLIITVIRFFTKPKQKLFSWFYFLGKLVLFVAVFMTLMHFKGAFYFIWGAFGFFTLGIMSLYLRKPKA